MGLAGSIIVTVIGVMAFAMLAVLGVVLALIVSGLLRDDLDDYRRSEIERERRMP